MTVLPELLEAHAGAHEAAAWRLGECCHVVLAAERSAGGDALGSAFVVVLRANDGGPELPLNSPGHLPKGWWKNRGFCAVTAVLTLPNGEVAQLHDTLEGARFLWLREKAMDALRRLLCGGGAGTQMELDYSPFTRSWTLCVHVDGEIEYV